MSLTVAVDLGGTSIKAALMDGVRALASDAIPAHSSEGLAPQLPRLAELIERLRAQAGTTPSACRGIGMAVPFLVDSARQRILSVPRAKYADAASIDLSAWSRARLGIPLKVENDAHAALLGEWRHGAGRGTDDFVMITLGTGIGCSVLLRGHPLRGKRSQAGVMGGHLIANPMGGAECGACPGTGCYEAESASLSIERTARADARFAQSALAGEPKIDFAAVFRCAAAGDALAAAVRDRCLRHWTGLLISLVHAYDPDRVVIGGGVSENVHARGFFPAMQDEVNRRAWVTEPVQVCMAELGNQAGAVGVASLFEQELTCI